MSRRIALPGADELFRATGSSDRATEQPSSSSPGPLTESPRPEPALSLAAAVEQAPYRSEDELDDAGQRSARAVPRRRARGAVDRRPSGRERHEEKITVYVSAEELMDLEHARLALRGDFGLAADRGRVVREALAVVLADFEAKGEASILVRRLRGH